MSTIKVEPGAFFRGTLYLTITMPTREPITHILNHTEATILANLLLEEVKRA